MANIQKDIERRLGVNKEGLYTYKVRVDSYLLVWLRSTSEDIWYNHKYMWVGWWPWIWADPQCARNNEGWIFLDFLPVLRTHSPKVDVVLVMDQERLYNDLQGDVAKQGRPIQVIKLNKSGGVVTRDTDYRRRSRMDKIKEYFYGPTGDLSPHSTLVDFDDFVLLRVGGGMWCAFKSKPSFTASYILQVHRHPHRRSLLVQKELLTPPVCWR